MEIKHKVRLGLVVSNKMDKTVVVAVETPKRHRLYRKTIKRLVRYKAHDAKNECQVGDKVLIVETRPLSREKRWRVSEIVAKAEVVEISPEEIAREDLARIAPEKKEKEAPEVKAEEAAAEKAEETAEKPAGKAKTKEKGKVTEAKAKEKAKVEKKTARAKPEEKAEAGEKPKAEDKPA